MTTKIEWTNETWNPVTGCTKISSGCKNCYAERMARRLAGRFGYPEMPHHFDVTIHSDKLEIPTKWKKPRMIFVCSMGDLFHDDVPFMYRIHILSVIENTPRHTYLMLTKRPQKMAFVLNDYYDFFNMAPLHNLWIGVTAENQKFADERIRVLVKIPAAVRFVSVEPMLEPIKLPWHKWQLDWVICGGETGYGARPMEYEWAYGLYQQCKKFNIPFFFKKAGDASEDSIFMREMELFREYPRRNQ